MKKIFSLLVGMMLLVSCSQKGDKNVETEIAKLDYNQVAIPEFVALEQRRWAWLRIMLSQTKGKEKLNESF